MSDPIQNAALMAMFHKRFGIVPNYENLLEITYRLFIKKGDVVVDIGAHTGRHTDVFSALVGDTGSVHAFEPLPYAFAILNGRHFPHNVVLHNLAISQQSGRIQFVFARGAPEESGLRKKIYNNPTSVTPEFIEVETSSLDSFSHILTRLDFIKIDAEGAELDCIRSGIEIIRKNRPLMTVEYGYPSYSAFGNRAESLFGLAVSLGYVIGDLFGSYCADLNTWSKVCDVAYWDWFLVPLERIDEWQANIKIQ